MNKEGLKKELKEVVEKIKGNSKDAKFADMLIDRLLSLKGQIDVEPAVVHIPLTGREEVVDTGGCFKFTRNEFATVYQQNGLSYGQTKDGRFVTMRNDLKMAHVPFDKLFELFDKRKKGTLTEEEEKEYSTHLLASVCVCQLPFIASTDEHKMATAVLLTEEWMNQISELLDAELQDETPAEDAEFEKNNGMLNEIMGTDA